MWPMLAQSPHTPNGLPSPVRIELVVTLKHCQVRPQNKTENFDYDWSSGLTTPLLTVPMVMTRVHVPGCVCAQVFVVMELYISGCAYSVHTALVVMLCSLIVLLTWALRKWIVLLKVMLTHLFSCSGNQGCILQLQCLCTRTVIYWIFLVALKITGGRS